MRITREPRGFSLIELIIVVVIIGIIGAIAIPRLSRGADGANSSKLKQDLEVLNKALDLYAAEHDGAYPTIAEVAQQLTQYTDADGNVSATPTATHIYGPYLRAIPPTSGGKYPGSSTIALSDGTDVGWIYRPARARIYLNRGTVVDDTEEDTALGRLQDKVGL
ncbi:MAG: prepilin-type N-terminal cleavage/methylation domain-containing protein [Phycisphaeraceae bacterium]|nr:prepilin-type N-terminal cleavage/methylation domain-containing protein [Phycisphaeraceae bacterium]